MLLKQRLEILIKIYPHYHKVLEGSRGWIYSVICPGGTVTVKSDELKQKGEHNHIVRIFYSLPSISHHLKPAITQAVGHFEAAETSCEHNIDISSPFRLIQLIVLQTAAY